jgi:membrane associated rhomboid family serine protease
MRKVFEHPASHEVGHCESILKSHGIATVIRNENLSSLVGAVPFASAYPELWVVEDDDYGRATSLLKEYRSSLPSTGASDWTCANCRETIPSTFSACWNCNEPRQANEPALPPETAGLEHGSSALVTGDPARAARYPLTWSCMIIAGLVFAWKFLAPEMAMRFFAPISTEIYAGRWDGLLGSVFMHGDFMHLAFNLYWIWMFGSVLEANLRRGFWILLFLGCAIFSSAVQLAFGGEVGIGLSGVVYGLFGFMWFARPRYPAFAAVLTRNVTMLLMAWLLLCFVLSYANVYLVANGAHVGGLLAGSLIGWLSVRSSKIALYVSASLIILALASALYAPWSPSFLVTRASDLLQKGQTEKAYGLLDRAAQADGALGTWAAYSSAFFRQQRGDYSGAAKVFETALPKSEQDASFLNGYAWLLATAPNDSVRDGKKAVKLALSAAGLTDWKDAAVLDTLAAAYAESGDFASAVKWQTTVFEMGLKGDDVLERLTLYRRSEPFREPVPDSSQQLN